ncbi:CrcB protein [Rhodopseudomonas julia]|uniref:Fluoride-specific ion channel FluC n=1 Tax=Rhodopseudomonas julia TaxID=200617 RepID=A0ABU0C865_9BRAD|nr:fluoride efflux transporter CrcB [Rhodopseudomonas julia]MDQ0326711.1 CrcB protein [Rhodopseudomonas julia]
MLTVTSFLLTCVLVFLGGAIGGLGRFFVSGFVARRFGETFPWGTLTVNVIGCAAIGILAALFFDPARQGPSNLPLWALFVTGGLGSFTTVSSFALQTLALARAGEPLDAVLNIAVSLAACLLAAASGFGGAYALLGG